MALSRKLTKETKDTPPSVEELIMKGGSSGQLLEDKTAELTEEIKRLQLRIPVGKLNQIDQMVKRRPGKLSRHTWIMEAIEEKLQRDGEK